MKRKVFAILLAFIMGAFVLWQQNALAEEMEEPEAAAVLVQTGITDQEESEQEAQEVTNETTPEETPEGREENASEGVPVEDLPEESEQEELQNTQETQEEGPLAEDAVSEAESYLASTISKTGTVAKVEGSSVWIKTGPSTAYDRVYCVPGNAGVTVYGQTTGQNLTAEGCTSSIWYNISYGSYKGYMNSIYVDVTYSGRIEMEVKTDAAVRKAPNGPAEIASVKVGDAVAVIGETTSASVNGNPIWYKIITDEKTGYIPAAYLGEAAEVPIETKKVCQGKGDMDRDGTISLLDVSQAFKYITGELSDSAGETVADINSDGSVTIRDVAYLYLSASRSNGVKIFLSPSDQDDNIYRNTAVSTNECEQCQRIAVFLQNALMRNGFTTMLATNDYTMEERIALSNQWAPDVHLPLHTNGFNGYMDGTQIYYKGTDAVAVGLAKAIFAELAPLTPGSSNEYLVEYYSFAEIKSVTGAPVYVEAEFHDAHGGWIVNNVDTIAEAICKGICAYYGVEYLDEAYTCMP